MPKFNVTYERWDEEALEAGDTDDRGFVVEDVPLREAMSSGLEYARPSFAGYCEPSDSRIEDARWLTFVKWNDCTRENIEQGIDEQRALHFPENLTASSRRRVARLFGVRGA